MEILDVYPTRGTYAPGGEVELVAVTDTATGGRLRARITQLGDVVATLEHPIDGPRTTLAWRPPVDAPRGYGVDVEVVDPHGDRRGVASTAFDVLDTWASFPRYGFLSDFPPDRTDLTEVIEQLARHHVNALQFYDWQYRHDHLVAPAEVYDDPLGRRLSQTTIRRAIEAAHHGGMAAMAYVAIYAASTNLWRAEPDWALYDESGQALAFGDDFLGLMDPTRTSPWAGHLLDQCTQALGFGFDGIHLDQYGEPRHANDSSGKPVDLPGAFVDFISDLKARHPGSPVTMNAVKNWPIETLAPSPQDFTYIELWPDTPTYREVLDIVLGAHRLSSNPVVIAMYLPTDQPANVETADAILFAAGATRIELGEGRRLLTDPYFPNHQPLPDDLTRRLRRCHDLNVRYGEVVGPPSQLASDVQVQAPKGVVAVARGNGSHVGINLVNVADLGARWDQPHPAPPPRHDVDIVATGVGRVVRAWWASPEHPTARPLKVTGDHRAHRFTVPSLDMWSVAILEIEPGSDR